MGKSLEQVTTFARAACAAVWSRSASRQEMARLREEGHVAGEPCELAFSFSFAEGQGDAAKRSLAEAGFTVADASEASRGFLTVTTPVTLGAFAMSSASLRLRRVARRHDGHAEVIGLVGEKPRRIELTGPQRNPARARSVA